MDKPEVLMSGLAIGESPRWHEGRLWFSNWCTEEIVAVDLDGDHEVVGHGPPGLGWATEWLPDGRLLVTGQELMRREPDGRMVRHVDLSGVADHGWNEIVVDGRGNIYVNGFSFDFLGGAEPTPGIIAVVTPDGSARKVADGLDFPNGMVVTPDKSTLIIAESFAGRLTAFDIEDDGGLSNRRVWADLGGPGNGDGICLDAEGAVWTPAQGNACARVLEGGQVLQRIQLDRPCFACMLGGPDRRTLFMMAADWQGVENVDDVIARRTGQVLVQQAPAPGAGWP
ncbi:MAG TPA: SMP-30/gluconolactonase/LRE family protein [Mycobacterium sp.]|nr:SMP-30/gluconolactonase/LRE family protein [Mycobacterium sp.]